jgi:hypothetical protein
MRIALGAALFLLSPVARAEDGGDRGSSDDAAADVAAADAAAFVDAATIACDGALCATQTGTTCDLGGLSPGRNSPSSAGGFAILGALSLAAAFRRSARPRASAPGAGRRAHLGEAWRAKPPRSERFRETMPKESQ